MTRPEDKIQISDRLSLKTLVLQQPAKKESLSPDAFQKRLESKISPIDRKVLADLVVGARKKPAPSPSRVTLEMEVSLVGPGKKVKAVELYRRLLMIGCGRVNSEKLEKGFLRDGRKGDPHRLVGLWPRSAARTMTSLLLRGNERSLVPILNGIASASRDFFKDTQIEVFK